jgi:hypothetical protein
MIITLSAQIPSGKNQIKETFVRGKKVRYPDQRFVAWREMAGLEVLQQKARWPTALKMALPLRGDLAMAVSYCPQDKTLRDLPGMLDALCHLLGYLELIEDDGQIKSLQWEVNKSIKACVTMDITCE